MQKSIFLILLIGIAASLAGCGGNVPEDKVGMEHTIQTIPRTPEEVVQRYQAYVDSNLFELAQSLSTPRSAPLHEMMAAIVADTPSDSSIIHTQFVQLDCPDINRDTVICTCLLRDEYEEYSSEYIVVKVDGRWLVDLPDEEGDFELFEQETLEEWPEQE